MDATRFDRLVASFVTSGSRRGLLRLLLALPLLSPLAVVRDDEGAIAKKKKKNKKKCAKAGQATSKKRKKCCSGLAKDASGLCATPITCIPATCTPAVCGSVPDGCGGTLSCSCAGNTLCLDSACQPCDVCLGGCTFGTVQAAINAAAPGETIRICAGAYNEDLAIAQGKNLSLIGAGQGNGAGNTILQGTGAAAVVKVVQGAAVNLHNLRVTGGGTTQFGGGIWNDGGNVTAANCTVTGNACTQNGGGVDNSGTMTLTGCTITGNNAANHGGGIGIGGGTLSLVGSVVSDNTAANRAGGIFVFQAALTLDANSRVTGNDANPADPDGGGGIYNQGTVTLNGAVVSGNTPTNCSPLNSIAGCNG